MFFRSSQLAVVVIDAGIEPLLRGIDDRRVFFACSRRSLRKEIGGASTADAHPLQYC